MALSWAAALVLLLSETAGRTKEKSESAMTETTFALAQGGDGEAFRELTDPYRRELQVHCYRILGSAQDAEDVLQEALLSAWRSIGSFDGVSLRAWLYRIATNRCLNHLRDESRRPRRAVGLPSPTAAEPVPAEDPSWLEPYPDRWIDEVTPGPEARYEARESVALSFVSALQHLPAKQRAALILRDVLGFPAAEAADILGTTAASVNSALVRARGSFRPPGQRPRPPSSHRGGKSSCRPFCRGIRERRHRPGVIAARRRRQAGDATPAHRVPRPGGGWRVLQVVSRPGAKSQARRDPSQRPARLWLLPLGPGDLGFPRQWAHGPRSPR